MPGLKGTPGIDAETRTARLTTQLDVIQDDQKREVGFLGRAHPLVRRALDRVRHLAFGGTTSSVDQRVTAVAGDVPAPTLLFTFIGRIHSRAGREFEQVPAVLVQPTNANHPPPSPPARHNEVSAAARDGEQDAQSKIHNP